MTATIGSSARAARRMRWWRLRLSREIRFSDRPALIALIALVLLLVLAVVLWPAEVAFGVLVVPMVLGSLWLGPKVLPWFVVFCLAGVTLLLGMHVEQINSKTASRVLTTFLVAFLILVSSFRRSRLGVAGPRGESMFIDLRDRIAKQGVIPRLPREWYVESVTRSAGGTSFAGDFIVASRTHDQHFLELVVVDVSGKGVEAGTRALLLSGAFGGIVSALPPGEFLPAANEYLVRQDWDEGFATAIHLHLDLRTGEFEVRKAGHPPAIWLHAGSGRWSVLDSEGPILGLVDNAEFECLRGALERGDAMLLYTDGLVETHERDIASGIDKLTGRGQRLFQVGFEGGARKLINELEATNDDRALLLVHRR